MGVEEKLTKAVRDFIYQKSGNLSSRDYQATKLYFMNRGEIARIAENNGYKVVISSEFWDCLYKAVH